jgi:hypothetical protein
MLEHFLKKLSAFYTARIRRDDYQWIIADALKHVVRKYPPRVEVYGLATKSVLECDNIMNINGNHGIGSHRLQQHGYIPCGYGVMRFGLAILARIGEVRNYRRHTGRAALFHRTEKEKETA